MPLVLAIQRPDANVLPVQIKNNIDIRICGRSDLVLSQIILDNGDAAALPKDIPGRFLCSLDGGTVFQGYTLEPTLSKKADLPQGSARPEHNEHGFMEVDRNGTQKESK